MEFKGSLALLVVASIFGGTLSSIEVSFVGLEEVYSSSGIDLNARARR